MTEQPTSATSDILANGQFQAVMRVIHQEIDKQPIAEETKHDVARHFLFGIFGEDNGNMLFNGVSGLEKFTLDMLANIPTEKRVLADGIHAAVMRAQSMYEQSLEESPVETDATLHEKKIVDATRTVARKALDALGKTFALEIPAKGGRELFGGGLLGETL